MEQHRRDARNMHSLGQTEAKEFRTAAIVFVILAIVVWSLAIVGGIDLASALLGNEEGLLNGQG